ncbi:MAG: hypothetical protein ACK5H2_02370 [Beutenbergiaceae bacterium]
MRHRARYDEAIARYLNTVTHIEDLLADKKPVDDFVRAAATDLYLTMLAGQLDLAAHPTPCTAATPRPPGSDHSKTLMTTWCWNAAIGQASMR